MVNMTMLYVFLAVAQPISVMRKLVARDDNSLIQSAGSQSSRTGHQPISLATSTAARIIR
jgi:hypothetical protein